LLKAPSCLTAKGVGPLLGTAGHIAALHLIYALNMSGLNDSFHNGNKENRPQSKCALPRRTRLPTEAA
jgi:hypothetical protein